jgi:hypothetical protein
VSRYSAWCPNHLWIRPGRTFVVDLPNINIEAKPGKGDQLLLELAAQTEYWVTAEDAPE